MEDDPVSGRAMAALLRYFGYSVELVSSVRAGLEHLAFDRQRPQIGAVADNVKADLQCVLLDLMLPDGDGALILARVRAARAETRARIHVAVITCVMDQDRIEVLRRLGADRVFTKPVDLQDLLAWIRQVTPETANPSDQTVRPADDLPGLHLQ